MRWHVTKNALPLLLLCLGLTGCMDLRVRMEINQDWTGIAGIRIEMLDQIYQMVAAQMRQSGEEAALFSEDALNALVSRDEGKIRLYNNSAKDGVRVIETEVFFKDARNMTQILGDDQIALTEEDGVWRLSFMNAEINNAFQDMGQEQIEQQLTLMAPMMTGLKWNFRIKTPHLVDSNVSKLGPNTAGFSHDFDKELTGKTGMEAVNLFRGLTAPKWVRFKMKP